MPISSFSDALAAHARQSRSKHDAFAMRPGGACAAHARRGGGVPALRPAPQGGRTGAAPSGSFEIGGASGPGGLLRLRRSLRGAGESGRRRLCPPCVCVPGDAPRDFPERAGRRAARQRLGGDGSERALIAVRSSGLRAAGASSGLSGQGRRAPLRLRVMHEIGAEAGCGAAGRLGRGRGHSRPAAADGGSGRRGSGRQGAECRGCGSRAAAPAAVDNGAAFDRNGSAPTPVSCGAMR
jgi:hypothetical protein